MKKLMIATILSAFSTITLADDNVIITQTKTWKSIPITINADTYTYGNVALPEGDYYFTYSKHRCLRDKAALPGVNPIIYRSSVAGGPDIYCYTE